jgi:hypothetical protein
MRITVRALMAAATVAGGAGPVPLVTRPRAFAIDEALYTVGGCTTALRESQVVERVRLAS